MTRSLIGVASSSGGGPGTPGYATSLVPTLRFSDPNYVVDLVWNAPVSNGGSAITDYVVQYSSDAGSTWTTFADGTSTSTSTTVTDLTPNQTYVFRVKAINALGDGPYTDKSSPVAITSTVPGKPTNVVGTPGNTQASLTWNAPVNTGGIALTDYVIQYSSNSGATWTTFSDGVSTNTYATVTGLNNGTTYTFQVAAVNATGTGAYSDPSSPITLAGAPFAPTSLSSSPGDGSLTISFTAGGDNGAAITNYQYALSTNSGSSYGAWTAISPVDTASPVTISGLTNGTAYYVKLRAINSVGEGAESSAVTSGTTPRGLPIVNSLTVDRFNQNRATFNATISANGGTISAVTFRYGTSSNFSGALTASAVGTTDAYYNATSLTVGTVHYVRVEVTNEAGTTTSSSTSFSTWGIKETILTQTSSNVTVPTITPRGGSRINPSILELALFGGGGASGTYGAAGGGGGYQSSASIEVVEGSGIVTWTIGAAGADSTIAGLSGGTLTAAKGASGSNLQPDGYSSQDFNANDPGYAMTGPPAYSDPAPYLSGASGNGNAAGGGYYWVYDKSTAYAYGGGGGAGGAGSSYTGSKSTATGGAGGAAATVQTVVGGSGGGGGSDVNVYAGAQTQSAYGGGAGFYNGGVYYNATAGVVRFKYYGV